MHKVRCLPEIMWNGYKGVGKPEQPGMHQMWKVQERMSAGRDNIDIRQDRSKDEKIKMMRGMDHGKKNQRICY